MTRYMKFIVMATVVLFIHSCNERAKYVKSQKIEIEYWGEVEEGDWIEVDGLRLYHITNDTSGGCEPDYEYNYLALNSDPDAEQFYLPSTKYKVCLIDDTWTDKKLTSGDLAFNLISALNEFAEQDEISLQLPYKNTSSIYYTTMGKLHLERTDGKAIKVSTSENYKGTVRIMQPSDAEE